MTHGDVIPNPDGSRSQCGGPWHCRTCRIELVEHRLQQARAGQTRGVKLHASMADALTDPRFGIALWERMETELASMQAEIDALKAERDELAAKKPRKAS